jgi:hypothetical protein
MSDKINAPSYTLRGKFEKVGYFPNMVADYMGQSSPPVTKYAHQKDKDFKNNKFSIGHQSRFSLPGSLEKMSERLPHDYKTLEPGFDRIVHPKNYKYDFKSMGFGKRSDFTDPARYDWVPGPIYENTEKTSMVY